MIHPLACTSSEFVSALLLRCGRGAQHARALYTSYCRDGQPNPNHPLFNKAPELYQELCSAIDFSCCSYTYAGEDSDAERFVLHTREGWNVEAVLMRMKHGYTLCVSSQVGCRMGCAFCRTGRLGWKRNLTAQEIVQQLYVAKHLLGREVRNVVFMGMGEPFDAQASVMQAVKVMTDPHGFGIGMRHVTISTSGDIQGILTLAHASEPMPHLALSLPSVDESLRAQLMPARKHDSLNDLSQAMHEYCSCTGKPIMVSYVVLGGVNDSAVQIEALCDFLQGLPVKVNLIPWNTFPEGAFQAPSPESIALCKEILHHRGYRVLQRGAKGKKVKAACGLLGNFEKDQKSMPTP